MHGYVQGILDHYHHAISNKSQLYPHKHTYISYIFTVQYAAEAESSPTIDALGIEWVQGIVGALLYYARAVNNKLLVALSAIGSQQASATKCTSAVITQLLGYIYAYPIGGINYCASSMVLVGHPYASFIN